MTSRIQIGRMVFRNYIPPLKYAPGTRELYGAKQIIPIVSDWLLSLQPPSDVGSPFADFSTLNIEAICSSETSVNARSTQRHIPEDDMLHSHRCGDLKF
jgi:hypothetical protein